MFLGGNLLSAIMIEQGVPEVGMAIWVRVPGTHRVSDPTGSGTGMIFYPRVAPVPDPNRDGYEAGIFFTRG
jgi:hypothetical protein